jgi:hypothetical protein
VIGPAKGISIMVSREATKALSTDLLPNTTPTLTTHIHQPPLECRFEDSPYGLTPRTSECMA